MGIYDTFTNGNVSVQIKMTNDGDSMPIYNIDDEVLIEHCVLIGYEGVVVIQDNKVVMVTENVFNKWGNLLDCKKIIDGDNPISMMLEDYNEDIDLYFKE